MINTIEPNFIEFNDSSNKRIENKIVNIIEEFAIGDITPILPRLNALMNVNKGMNAIIDIAKAIIIYFNAKVVLDKKKGNRIIRVMLMKIPLKKMVFLLPIRSAGIFDKELLKPNPSIAMRPKMIPEEISIISSVKDSLYPLSWVYCSSSEGYILEKKSEKKKMSGP